MAPAAHQMGAARFRFLGRLLCRECVARSREGLDVSSRASSSVTGSSMSHSSTGGLGLEGGLGWGFAVGGATTAEANLVLPGRTVGWRTGATAGRGASAGSVSEALELAGTVNVSRHSGFGQAPFLPTASAGTWKVRPQCRQRRRKSMNRHRKVWPTRIPDRFIIPASRKRCLFAGRCWGVRACASEMSVSRVGNLACPSFIRENAHSGGSDRQDCLSYLLS